MPDQFPVEHAMVTGEAAAWPIIPTSDTATKETVNAPEARNASMRQCSRPQV